MISDSANDERTPAHAAAGIYIKHLGPIRVTDSYPTLLAIDPILMGNTRPIAMGSAWVTRSGRIALGMQMKLHLES